MKSTGHPGSAHHAAKLTEEAVLTILTDFHQHGKSASILARRYNVSPTTIYFIVRRVLWTHVPYDGPLRPLQKRRKRINPKQRFQAKVKLNAETGCHEWQGSMTGTGPCKYGYFTLNRDGRLHVLAHHAAWYFQHGHWPDASKGELLCHKCDNSPCVNPAHLILADHTWNVRDSIRKGRLKPFQAANKARLNTRTV